MDITKETVVEMNIAAMEINEEEVKKLVSNLSNKDWLIRHNSRKALVKIGPGALSYLEQLAGSPDYNTRWEVIKTIGDISKPSSVTVLTKAMLDPNVDIRWLAAEGLIELGETAVVQVLKTVIKYYDSVDLCEGAHHVLTELAKQKKFSDTTNLIPSLIKRDIITNIPMYAKAKLDEITHPNNSHTEIK